MYPLPRLELRDGPCRLPVLDRSLNALHQALIAPDGADLSATLRTDPTLALWCLLRAQREGVALASPAEMNRWLLDGGLGRAWLAAPDAPHDQRPWENEELAEGWATLFAESMLVSDLAGLIARERGLGAESESQLGFPSSPVTQLGLLHKAPIWIGLSRESVVASPDLPAWVAGPLALLANPPQENEAPEVACVREAQLVLARQRPAPASFGWSLDEAAERRRLLANFWERERDQRGGDETKQGLLHVIKSFARLQQLEADLEAEKLASLAEFAAGAGHEINNPLANISGRAQLLLRGERDPERRQDLAQIQAQALRVQAMIADLMLIARPPDPQPIRTDLAALIVEVVQAVREELGGRPIALEAQHVGEPLWVVADPTYLQVALRALVDNAVFAVSAGGRIEVSLASEPRWANIVVRDDGPGLTPHVRRHLFDPYFSGREAGRGLGMGLAKARRIAESHRGRLDVASAPGQGATFTIRLPRG